MAVEAAHASDARGRLRQSRAELFGLVRELQGCPPAARTGFPRSRLMQALMGRERSGWIAAAGLAVAVLRPRLVWRLLQWFLSQPLAQRHVLPWLVRRSGVLRQ